MPTKQKEQTVSKEDAEKASSEAEVINIAEDSIKVLLNQLQKVKIEKDVAVGSLILNLKEQEEELQKQSAPFDQEMSILQRKIMELVPSVAHSVKTESGSVSFRRGYTRASYDTDALDEFLESHQNIKRVIIQFRSETPVKSSVGKPEVY
jgi:hypothetical protein